LGVVMPISGRLSPTKQLQTIGNTCVRMGRKTTLK